MTGDGRLNLVRIIGNQGFKKGEGVSVRTEATNYKSIGLILTLRQLTIKRIILEKVIQVCFLLFIVIQSRRRCLSSLVEPERKTILDTTSDDFVEETDDLMENVRRKVRPHRYPCQSDAQYQNHALKVLEQSECLWFLI